MKHLSEILQESVKPIITEGKDSVALLADEIRRYIKATNPKMPRPVQIVFNILSKYPQLNTKEMILDIRDGKFKLFDKLDISTDELKELQKLLKKLGADIKLLPQFLNNHQRQMLELNKLSAEDVTMDLKTDAGRNKVAKQYGPLVFKIVNQFKGHCPLDMSELMSAGLMGLVNAMNEYTSAEDVEGEGGKKSTQTFGQYAAYQIRFQIMHDIYDYGKTVRMNQQAQQKEKASEEEVLAYMKELGLEPQSFDKPKGGNFRIDATYAGTEDDIKQDRLLALSETPDFDMMGDSSRQWKDVFTNLEKKFPIRDCEIFYHIWGLNGRKKEKEKDIAKRYNISTPNTARIMKKILSFLRQDERSLAMLREIYAIYSAQKCESLYNLSREQIIEDLLNDDLFLLLEGLNQWSDPKVYQNAVQKATDVLNIEDAKFIFDCMIKGFDFIDNNYRKNKNVIIAFLSALYPTESFKRKSDVDLIDYMVELADLSEKYKIKW